MSILNINAFLPIKYACLIRGIKPLTATKKMESNQQPPNSICGISFWIISPLNIIHSHAIAWLLQALIYSHWSCVWMRERAVLQPFYFEFTNSTSKRAGNHIRIHLIQGQMNYYMVRLENSLSLSASLVLKKKWWNKQKHSYI